MSRKTIFGASLGGALVIFIAGIVFWGGFNTVMEATNRLEFCISCHEMRDTVYQEYKQTIHYSNRTGVRATCADCHVPKDWVHKMVRKVQASGEVMHKILGSIDTPEKFEAKRIELAKRVWTTMKNTDSRECRNCHSFDGMNPEKQKGRAAKQHKNALDEKQTCIDCHKGIAHKPVHQLLDENGNLKPQAAAAPAQAAAPAPAPVEAAPAPASAPAASAPSAPSADGTDWSKAAEKEVVFFYPGQASFEWVQSGTDHGGARAFRKGDRCSECHGKEQAEMGPKIASGSKAEATPIPGKRGFVPVKVKALHDGTNLKMRFEWENAPHTPAPFVAGGKMDPANPIKLAMMIDQGKVETADRSGCWSTCHHDAKAMPDSPATPGAVEGLDLANGITKYLPATRTAVELKSPPLGGWNKLKPKTEIDAMLKDGAFLDLLRYKAGSGESEDGYVLEQRVMKGGQGVSFTGGLEGNKWVVVMTRKLASTEAGDISIAAGQLYTVGFALHDDYTGGRFHHVSLDYKLGLDNPEADINAVKQ